MKSTARGERANCADGFFVGKLRTMIAAENHKEPLLDFRLFTSANFERPTDDVACDAVTMHQAYLDGRFELLHETPAPAAAKS